MRFYKFALIKRWFDIGYGISSWFKYIVVLVGFDAVMKQVDMKWILLGGVIYALACFLVGYLWIKLGILEAEQEVSNVYNLFVKQMRRKVVVPKKRKI